MTKNIHQEKVKIPYEWGSRNGVFLDYSDKMFGLPHAMLPQEAYESLSDAPETPEYARNELGITDYQAYLTRIEHRNNLLKMEIERVSGETIEDLF